MSSNPQVNNDNQEIDLSQISKKVGEFFENCATSVFNGILFLKRNLIALAILFILGAGIGYYLDKTGKSYDSEIIVTPNFSSSDYLYSKINLLNSKITEGDTVYLKKLGFKETQKIAVIEVEPIIDIYKFINNNEQNFELIKLMAEDGDITKIAKDKLTSKNYPFHLLKISTSKKLANDAFVEPLLNYLNSSEYFQKVRKEYLNNIKIKNQQNDSIIKQIDDYLGNFKKSNGVSKSNGLVNISDNTQLNDIIKTKEALISEQGTHRMELLNYDRVVKEISISTNIKNNSGLNNKMKLVLPFLFVFLFVTFSIFKSFYKKQLAKSKL